MPELPEVDAVVGFLRDHCVGAVMAAVEPGSFAVLKTVAPGPDSLAGLQVTGVRRHGKLIDLDVDGLHLVIHLAKAGWIRWSDPLPATRVKLGSGPIALRVRFDHGDGPRAGFDLTEAGTRKGLAVWIVRDPAEVSPLAALGPDALDPDLDLAPLIDRRMQIKRLLRDQKVIAGIGNAYSDEILHAARLSPFSIAADLDAAEVERLAAAVREILTEARDRAAGQPLSELKDGKRTAMRVHGRAGEACPVCADTVAEVVFSDSSLQYCPTCQTGGRPLKDRSTSKFLR